MLNYLSLFSGIGGIDLGLDRTGGFKCVGQVECDPYCRAVLTKHWPDVPRFEDVRTFDPKDIHGRIDLICGGFPCQDISNANPAGKGLDGDRSGLWVEFARIIRAVRPLYALVENVPALAFRGLDRVLCDLADIGFDAEWSIVSACAVGAPHTRERMFVLGYSPEIAARRDERQGTSGRWLSMSGNRPCEPGTPWASEPIVGRVAHGIRRGMDRNGALGNAVVPQVAELIGRAILAAHAAAESERAA